MCKQAGRFHALLYPVRESTALMKEKECSNDSANGTSTVTVDICIVAIQVYVLYQL